MHVRDLSNRIQGNAPAVQPNTLPKQPATTAKHSRFDQALQQVQQDLAQQQQHIKLSAHAAQRIEERDISLTKQERIDLSQAIARLQDKGAKNALIVRKDAAFVVNVPNRTLVTAINQQELEQRVFTQIDSTMLI